MPIWRGHGTRKRFLGLGFVGLNTFLLEMDAPGVNHGLQSEGYAKMLWNPSIRLLRFSKDGYWQVIKVSLNSNFFPKALHGVNVYFTAF